MSEEHEPTLGDVIKALAILQDGQAQLQDGQARLEDGQARLEDGQTRLRVDLMARMDRLDERLTVAREEGIVNFGRADKAIEAVEGLRKSLATTDEQVAAMWRIVRRVQTEWDQMRG